MLKNIIFRASSIILIVMLSGCGVGGGGGSIAGTSSVEISSNKSSNASSSSVSNSSAVTSSVSGRSILDRPDKFIDKYQVHVIYAVPSDKQDHQLDLTNGLEVSLNAANNFFFKTTNQKIRFDETDSGHIDISFLRLPMNDNYYASKLAFARESVQTDVRTAGFNDPKKIYLVYYEGTNEATCGNAPSVGSGDGVTVLYLHGLGNFSSPCDSQGFTTDVSVATYWEFVPLHELVHTLSFVGACAPHGKTQPTHTSDDPSDLMYAGDQPWRPTTIDPGQDDYYGVNVLPSCPRNLMNSAFLEPQLGAEIPINFPHN